MTAWDFLAWLATVLLGGVLPARTALRFLAAPKGRVRWIAPYLVLGAALGMPTWMGDGNPLYYFPFLIAAFLIGYGGSLAARLVVGVIFFEWIIAWSMIVDTRAVLPGSADYWGAVVWKLAAWAAVWLLVRRALRDGRQIALSGRLWALLGLLALSPLLPMERPRLHGGDCGRGARCRVLHAAAVRVRLLGRAATRGRAAFTAPGA